MIIALVLLSLAMILGGLFAAFQGWEIVVLERGWSLMIAGSVSAASGALLLGVTAAVAHLASIRRELAELADRMSRAELSSVLPPPPSRDLAAAAAAPGLLGGLGPDQAPPGGEEEPNLPDFMRRPEDRDRPPTEDATERQPDPRRSFGEEHPEREAPESEAPRLRLPGNLFRLRREETTVEELEPAGPLREPAPQPAPEPFGLSDPDREPERDGPLSEEAPAPARTIVGSYNAGDNRYVMFSDGSIDAETPQGMFHFDSLDELKQFIASGGDKPPTSS